MSRIIFVLLLCPILLPRLWASPVLIKDCQPAREFITSYNFLLKEVPLHLSDEMRRDTAWKVAAGCHQAAARFIRVLKTLLKAEMDPHVALSSAIELSQGDEVRVRSFLAIFRLARDRRYFDLDLFQSLKLARSLTVDLEDLPLWLEKDFRRLSLFCLNEAQLGLPRPLCARWAQSLVLQTARQMQDGKPLSIGVAKPFFEIFEFLTANSGPQLTTADTLALAQRLLAISPYAIEAFIEAYEFAIHPAGLKLDRHAALEFAERLAAHTVRSRPPNSVPTKSWLFGLSGILGGDGK